MVKTFSGITDEDLAELSGFAIAYESDDAEQGTAAGTLTVEGAKKDGKVYSWTIEGAKVGETLTFTETGYEHADYEVTPNEETGTLLVEEGGENEYAIENDYERKLATLTVSKTVVVPEGFTVNKDQEFKFTVTMDETLNGYTAPEGVTLSEDKTTLTFVLKHGESIDLTNLPVGATATVEEVEVPQGYTVTAPEKNPTSVVIPEAGTSIAFTNTYTAKEVIVDPTKDVFGKKNLVKTTEDGNGHTFEFTLKADTKDAPMPKSATASVSYEAGATGEQTIPFGEIEYTKPGEYKYTISETVGEYTAENGWTITNNDVKVTVTVTDDGKGQLVAEVTGGEAIENSYTPKDVDVDPTDTETTFGIKNFTATTEALDHTFKFTLEANTESAPMPASATAEVTYAAGAIGEQVIPFGIITYKKIGEYKYTITEDTTEYTAEKGWTTGGPITVTVTVTDNGKGQLEAKVTGGTIENSQRDVWTELTVRKTWLDNDNAQGLRPTVIRVYLYANGERINFVTLNAANGWDRTVRNLPVYDENGERIRYTWREQDIPGYTLIQTFTRGNVTRFVNAIDEYGTPLGLGEVFINVGECFE